MRVLGEGAANVAGHLGISAAVGVIDGAIYYAVPAALAGGALSLGAFVALSSGFAGLAGVALALAKAAS